MTCRRRRISSTMDAQKPAIQGSEHSGQNADALDGAANSMYVCTLNRVWCLLCCALQGNKLQRTLTVTALERALEVPAGAWSAQRFKCWKKQNWGSSDKADVSAKADRPKVAEIGFCTARQPLLKPNASNIITAHDREKQIF